MICFKRSPESAKYLKKGKKIDYSKYVCSTCGQQCYYDGRCGDGPITTCNCGKSVSSSEEDDGGQ